MNRRDQGADQCEAHVAPRRGSGRCEYAAKHRHGLPDGSSIKCCKRHYDMLLRHERPEHRVSDVELVTGWREG